MPLFFTVHAWTLIKVCPLAVMALKRISVFFGGGGEIEKDIGRKLGEYRITKFRVWLKEVQSRGQVFGMWLSGQRSDLLLSKHLRGTSRRLLLQNLDLFDDFNQYRYFKLHTLVSIVSQIAHGRFTLTVSDDSFLTATLFFFYWDFFNGDVQTDGTDSTDDILSRIITHNKTNTHHSINAWVKCAKH